MSQSKTLYGVTYQVPETKDPGWGPTVTAILMNLMTAVDGLSVLPGSVPLLRLIRGADLAPAASGSLSWTSIWHRVAGNGGAVTLSASTPIAAGGTDGQLLLLTGTSDVNTVFIPTGGNVSLNGDALLVNGGSLFLAWDGAASKWVEIGRNG